MKDLTEHAPDTVWFFLYKNKEEVLECIRKLEMLSKDLVDSNLILDAYIISIFTNSKRPLDELNLNKGSTIWIDTLNVLYDTMQDSSFYLLEVLNFYKKS